MTVETFEFTPDGALPVQVRVIPNSQGELWFVTADVLAALGLARSSSALLPDDEKGVQTLYTLGGSQQVAMVTEAGLYRLIMRSTKPEAKQFQRWIAHDVLPAIRQHGGYLTPATIEQVLTDPDTIIRLATDLKTERARRIQLEAKTAADAPKVLFADAVATAPNTILIGELAKILKGNGIDIGQNRLFHWMRLNEYLIKRAGTDYNMPTQRAMQLGLFEIKETAVTHADGHVTIQKTTKVTGKGQQYFIDRLLSRWPDEAVAA